MSIHQESDNIIQVRLEQMADRATKRRVLLNSSSQLNPDCYIRVCGGGYSAVSLNEVTPLMGFSQHNPKNIETILKHFKEREPRIPGRDAPERKIQNWLIKQSFHNNLDLKSPLGLDDEKYDELLFALDEISLEDHDNGNKIRCDILAVGVKNGNAFPVLIELKSGRLKTELTKQINNFERQINNFRTGFENLLSCCVGRPVSVSENIGKMIIWPTAGEAGIGSIEAFNDDEIDVIEYKWDHKNEISRIRFFAHYC